jgi:hypothetical protein
MKNKAVLIMLATLMFGLGVMCFATKHYVVAAIDFMAAGLDLHAALRRR